MYYLRVYFDANRPEGELVFVILYADLTPYSLAKTNIRFVLIARTAQAVRDLSEISRGEGGGNRGRVTTF